MAKLIIEITTPKTNNKTLEQNGVVFCTHTEDLPLPKDEFEVLVAKAESGESLTWDEQRILKIMHYLSLCIYSAECVAGIMASEATKFTSAHNEEADSLLRSLGLGGDPGFETQLKEIMEGDADDRQGDEKDDNDPV